jgi:sulfate/thiosulfate transport system ATP-binding protein
MSVAAQQIRKTFGSFTALDGVNLNVERGKLVALLGPSGSGKTTLLRIIAGLEYADPGSGRILFHGDDVTDVPAGKRKVGFVFQHYALFRHMTVFENIAFGLKVRGRKERPAKAEIGERVRKLLKLVQLESYGGRFPHQLSGGQRQRIALARALAVEPKVLLLDEPFGALDAKVRKELRRWLRQFHDEIGLTTIFVTHDQEEALELADRVAIFNHGRIEQIGTADDVLDRPATAFVAGFVGEAVRLPVDAAGSWIRIGRHQVRTAEENVAGPAELFVRPRDLAIASPGTDAIPARVIGVRRSGPSRRAELSLGDDLPTVEIELTDGRSVRRGDVLPVVLSTVRLFTRLEGS